MLRYRCPNALRFCLATALLVGCQAVTEEDESEVATDSYYQEDPLADDAGPGCFASDCESPGAALVQKKGGKGGKGEDTGAKKEGGGKGGGGGEEDGGGSGFDCNAAGAQAAASSWLALALLPVLRRRRAARR